jgi:NitT/TauT family transport system substrate-binding protein
VRKYSPDEIKPATDAFALLAKFGGTDIVGDATDIAEGTFWKGYQK